MMKFGPNQRTMYPKGFDRIAPKLKELEENSLDLGPDIRLKGPTAKQPQAKMQANYDRSRYVYNLFYKNNNISRELFDFLIKNGYADQKLIQQWRKPGYEKLCCLECMKGQTSNFGGSCICRIPRSTIGDNVTFNCHECGCMGCSTKD